MKKIGVGNGTLSHHLHMLEKMDLIKSRREGMRYRAFYLTNMKFPKTGRFRFTELQTSIINAINKNDGISQKEIVDSLKQKKQTINYNIKLLQRNGIISLEKKGRNTYCHLNVEV